MYESRKDSLGKIKEKIKIKLAPKEWALTEYPYPMTKHGAYVDFVWTFLLYFLLELMLIWEWLVSDVHVVF